MRAVISLHVSTSDVNAGAYDMNVCICVACARIVFSNARITDAKDALITEVNECMTHSNALACDANACILCECMHMRA